MFDLFAQTYLHQIIFTIIQLSGVQDLIRFILYIFELVVVVISQLICIGPSHQHHRYETLYKLVHRYPSVGSGQVGY